MSNHYYVIYRFCLSFDSYWMKVHWTRNHFHTWPTISHLSFYIIDMPNLLFDIIMAMKDATARSSTTVCVFLINLSSVTFGPKYRIGICFIARKNMLKVWMKSKEWSKYNYGVLVLLNHLSKIKARQNSCRVCQTGQFLSKL